MQYSIMYRSDNKSAYALAKSVRGGSMKNIVFALCMIPIVIASLPLVLYVTLLGLALTHTHLTELSYRIKEGKK